MSALLKRVLTIQAWAFKESQSKLKAEKDDKASSEPVTSSDSESSSDEETSSQDQENAPTPPTVKIVESAPIKIPPAIDRRKDKRPLYDRKFQRQMLREVNSYMDQYNLKPVLEPETLRRIFDVTGQLAYRMGYSFYSIDSTSYFDKMQRFANYLHYPKESMGIGWLDYPKPKNIWPQALGWFSFLTEHCKIREHYKRMFDPKSPAAVPDAVMVSRKREILQVVKEAYKKKYIGHVYVAEAIIKKHISDVRHRNDIYTSESEHSDCCEHSDDEESYKSEESECSDFDRSSVQPKLEDYIQPELEDYNLKLLFGETSCEWDSDDSAEFESSLEDFNLKQLFGETTSCEWHSEDSDDTENSDGETDTSGSTFKELSENNSSESDSEDCSGDSESTDNEEDLDGTKDVVNKVHCLLLENMSEFSEVLQGGNDGTIESSEADVSESTKSNDTTRESRESSCGTESEGIDDVGLDLEDESCESRVVLNKGYCRLLENIFREELGGTLQDGDWEIDFPESSGANDTQEQLKEAGCDDNEKDSDGKAIDSNNNQSQEAINESFSSVGSIEDEKFLVDVHFSTMVDMRSKLAEYNARVKQLQESQESCQDTLEKLRRENDEVHEYELEIEREVRELEASIAQIEHEEWQMNAEGSKEVHGGNLSIEEDSHVDR